MAAFSVGDAVQTPHGKGVVHEVRNGGRLLVRIQARMVVVAAAECATATAPRRAPVAARPETGQAPRPAGRAEAAVDLHGLRVDEALHRIDDALDAALRAGLAELRFIHGRSGGRLRGALHERLRGISAVRGVRLDPRNAGVTIVSL
ncbi:MAG: Smr/MutS family protein [Acidobacteria bacterium]|nr:Smr/MutS family protein [Acidobacteriota bacterium]